MKRATSPDLVSSHAGSDEVQYRIVALGRSFISAANTRPAKKKKEAQQAVEPNGSGAFCSGDGDFWLAVGSL